MMAAPWLAKCLIASKINARDWGSTPTVGSSNKYKSGCGKTAMAKFRRRLSPPDKFCARVLPK